MAEKRYNSDSAHELWSRILDETAPPIVIAEISGNHNGSKQRAIQLVRAAADSGADVVKFQHYRADTITARSTRPEFRVGSGSLWEGRYLWDLYEEAATPWDWTEDLVSAANDAGIAWFSSPFDETAVDFLEKFDPPMYKVASFEIVDLPLVKRIAETGKPMIVSTGMATQDEISAAVSVAQGHSSFPLVLLRTNSAYPASPDEMNLRALTLIADSWKLPVGLSDHTLSDVSAIVATAHGARVFEKHFTLNRSDGGPDSAFSLEPEELRRYVSSVREAHSTLGRARLGPSEKEASSIRFRPSIRATANIAHGELFSPANTATVRPSGGLEPKYLPEVLGKKATRDISVGEPLQWADIT